MLGYLQFLVTAGVRCIELLVLSDLWQLARILEDLTHHLHSLVHVLPDKVSLHNIVRIGLL